MASTHHTHDMNTGKLIAYFLLLLGQSTWSHGQPFTVRDSQTGAAIEADIVVQSINPADLNCPNNGKRIRLGQEVTEPPCRSIQPTKPVTQPVLFSSLPPSQHLQILRVTAVGYQPLQTWVEAHSHIPITQDHARSHRSGPQSCTDHIDNRTPAIACDQAIICGFLYDQSQRHCPWPMWPSPSPRDQFHSQVFTVITKRACLPFTKPLPKTVHHHALSTAGYQAQQWTEVRHPFTAVNW